MLSFKHSGNAGDIIYSIPAIQSICREYGETAQLVLITGVRLSVVNPDRHPTGGVQLNKKMAEMLVPLLLANEYIVNVYITDDKDCDCDYDLDRFRRQPINLGMGNISRWYSNIINLPIDLHEAWLHVYGQKNDRVVIARSERYNNPNLNYKFLSEYSPLFVGIEQEFEMMKEQIPTLEYRPVNNFYEMAQVIKGSSLFISNQSLPYAIAEAMKVKRVLEPCLYAGNVIPCGGLCVEAYTQRSFEKIVEWMLNK